MKLLTTLLIILLVLTSMFCIDSPAGETTTTMSVPEDFDVNDTYWCYDADTAYGYDAWIWQMETNGIFTWREFECLDNAESCSWETNITILKVTNYTIDTTTPLWTLAIEGSTPYAIEVYTNTSPITAKIGYECLTEACTNRVVPETWADASWSSVITNGRCFDFLD